MWRYLLFTIVGFFLISPVQAQLQNEDISYAILELTSYSVSDYPEGYWQEKSRIENEKQRAIDPSAPEDDFIVISNSCGLQVFTYDVLHSTSNLPETMTVETGLGEWCRIPFRKFGRRYLAIIEDGEPTETYPIHYSEKDDHEVLLLHQDELDYLKESALIPFHINYREFPDTIDAPSHYNPHDPEVIDYVARAPYLEIRNDDYYGDYIVFTKAIAVRDFFKRETELP